MPASAPRSPQRHVWPWTGLIRLDGRSSRYQWWLVTTISWAALYLLLMPTVSTGTESTVAPGRFAEPASTQPPIWTGMLVVFFFALCLSLILAVSVRRLHDRSRTGLWVLISVVPAIGQLWLFFELGVLPGTRGPNRYG